MQYCTTSALPALAWLPGMPVLPACVQRVTASRAGPGVRSADLSGLREPEVCHLAIDFTNNLKLLTVTAAAVPGLLSMY